MTNAYGMKLSDNLINDILVDISTIDNIQEKNQLMLILNRHLGNKFKSYDVLYKDLIKLGKILENENSFNDTLGYDLANFFDVNINNYLIIEDSEKNGRTIKEKRRGREKVLYEISDENLKTQNIDTDIKRFNFLANNCYDAIEGRVITA